MFKGMDLAHGVNRLRAGFVALAQNVRQLVKGAFGMRNVLAGAIYTLEAAVVSIGRLNDSTPNGPSNGYSLITVDTNGNLYCNGTVVATGLSGNPVSMIPFRPNASVQPWMYIGDSSHNVTIATNGGVQILTGIVLGASGSYAVNDVITIVQSGGSGCTIKVLTVSFQTVALGHLAWMPATWEILTAGMGYSVANGVSTSGGSGSGWTVNIVSIGGYSCTGMLKVRSDGLCYKMGIQEPQLAPSVSTANTSVNLAGTLLATAIPWTNYSGANSPSYSYGETNGYPNPSPDGTAPFVINVQNATSVTIVSLTGTATINGGSKTPTSTGPSPSATTNPGHYVMAQGTGTTPPSSATVVIGAFCDGSGNVVAAGVVPLYIPAVVDVGGSIGTAITVPYGAQTFQVGINSTGNTFSSNSGSFALTATVTTVALPTVTSVFGNLTAYVWGDSPTSGPTGEYVFKNPDDPSGSGTARSVTSAAQTSIGNSFILDATFTAGIPGLPGIGSPSIPMMWSQLNPQDVVTGSVPLYAPAIKGLDGNTAYQNFNACIVGRIYIPAGGQYTFTLTNKDDVIWGIQNATLISSSGTSDGGSVTPTLSGLGQTITVANGYPLLPRAWVSGSGEGGEYSTTTVVVSFPTAGSYGIEIDYDYWYHSGRILLLTASPTPGASPTIIPPLPAGVRQNVSYAYKYRSSKTGAVSNPSPTSTPQTTPVLANVIASVFSTDPQVDKVDYYRQDSALANYTYVATGPNDNGQGSGVNTAIDDSLTDIAAASNPIMAYDDFEPFPSIDLPRAGTCNVSGGVITWLTGDTFNTRWLAGTEILIGSPTQIAYSLIARPTSSTSMTIPGVPDGTNLVWNIAEPTLAAQPLPYLFGPTDNIVVMHGVGDPLRPGVDYWTKGNNFDSAPDTNQEDVTSPSEPLINGVVSGGVGILASNQRVRIVAPNQFDALETVTGTEGTTWTYRLTPISRGLYMPRCITVSGGGNIFFRVEDGIHISNGGTSQSITDAELYPIFPHEGSTPTSVTRAGVTIYPPDDTKPQMQQFSVVGQFMYWDYMGTDEIMHTLVFDEQAMGWIWDVSNPKTFCHASDTGQSQQGVLVGCGDGTVRLMQSTGSETPTAIVLTGAIGGVGWQYCSAFTIEYSSNSTITITPIVADEGNGSYAPQPVTLPSTGGQLTKYRGGFTQNKWKLLQFEISFNDPTAIVYLEGLEIDAKSWGDEGYRKASPFSYEGGYGGEA